MIRIFEIATICFFIAGIELAIFFEVMKMEGAYGSGLLMSRALVYILISALILRFTASNRAVIDEMIRTKNHGLLLKIVFGKS